MSRVDVSAIWRDAAASLARVSPENSTPEALRIVNAWLSEQETTSITLETARAAQQHLVQAGLAKTLDRLLDDAFTRISATSSPQDLATIEAALSVLQQRAAQIRAPKTFPWVKPSSIADAILTSALPETYAADLALRLQELCRRKDAGIPITEQELRIPLYDRFEPVLHLLVYNEIERHIAESFTGDWTTIDVPLETKKWLQTYRYPFVLEVARASVQPMADESVLERLIQSAVMRFEYHIYRTLMSLRIKELFDIIVDWPDSEPALIDLKTCLSKVDQGRKQLCSSLRDSTKRRLLHPGADTKDILDHYIRTIRALRIVDPPGVLLAIVAEPVRAYLRGRQDAIRSIMTAMMEQESLWGDEQAHGGIGLLANEEEEDFRDPNLTWEPDPVDAPAHFRKDRNSDIVQMLTSIYDTKDVFVKEFQTLLATRLLQIDKYDADKEHRHVEILKKRFGEALLQNCEVMLKDIIDSKRIDNNIHERYAAQRKGKIQSSLDFDPHTTVVSKLFWPTLSDVELVLPTRLESKLDIYQKEFDAYKPEKQLKWMKSLGHVKVSLEFADRTFSEEVTVPQATVIACFAQNEPGSDSSLTYESLLTRCGGKSVDALIRNALYFWSNQGVLREDVSTGVSVWKVIEKVSDAPPPVTRHAMAEDAPLNAQDDQVERLRMHWQYIQGMLTNLGAMPLDRIHDMLSKFLPDYGGQSEAQLGMFMEQMQREGLVESIAGNKWKLAKD